MTASLDENQGQTEFGLPACLRSIIKSAHGRIFFAQKKAPFGAYKIKLLFFNFLGFSHHGITGITKAGNVHDINPFSCFLFQVVAKRCLKLKVIGIILDHGVMLGANLANLAFINALKIMLVHAVIIAFYLVPSQRLLLIPV